MLFVLLFSVGQLERFAHDIIAVVVNLLLADLLTKFLWLLALHSQIIIPIEFSLPFMWEKYYYLYDIEYIENSREHRNGTSGLMMLSANICNLFRFECLILFLVFAVKSSICVVSFVVYEQHKIELRYERVVCMYTLLDILLFVSTIVVWKLHHSQIIISATFLNLSTDSETMTLDSHFTQPVISTVLSRIFHQAHFLDPFHVSFDAYGNWMCCVHGRRKVEKFHSAIFNLI